MIQPCLHCMISKTTQLYTMALYHYACLHSSVAALLGSLMFCWWPYYHWVAFWQNTILDFLLASLLTSKLIQIVQSWWFCYIQPLKFLFCKIWLWRHHSSLHVYFLTSFWQILLMPHVPIQTLIGPSIDTAWLAHQHKPSRPSGT